MTTIRADYWFSFCLPSYSPSTTDEQLATPVQQYSVEPASSVMARANSAFARILRECSIAGWDGYDAKPISEATCKRAEAFLNMLPSWMPAPEITPESDGELDIEWYYAPDKTFSVSLGETGPLHYAGLFGANEEVHGVTSFKDSIPKNLFTFITDVLPKTTPSRAA